MSAAKNKREFIKLVKEACPGATFAHGGSHLKAILIGPLGSQMLIESLTPSDHRIQKNRQRELRRILREIGLAQDHRNPAESQLKS